MPAHAPEVIALSVTDYPPIPEKSECVLMTLTTHFLDGEIMESSYRLSSQGALLLIRQLLSANLRLTQRQEKWEREKK